MTSLRNNCSLDDSFHSISHPPLPPLDPPGSPNGVENFPGQIHSPNRKHYSPHFSPQQQQFKTTSDDGSCSSVCSSNSSSSTSSHTTTKAALVRFHPKVRVRTTISHYEMSDQEHADCWFQDHEYQSIRKRNRAILRAVEASHKSRKQVLFGHRKYIRNSQHHRTLLQTIPELAAVIENSNSTNESDDNCLRGLESCLKHQRKRRHSLVKSATNKVLFEQAAQRCHSGAIVDDSAIARAYSKVAFKCRYRAQARALKDHDEVKEGEDNTGLTSSLSSPETACDDGNGYDADDEHLAKKKTENSSPTTRRKKGQRTNTCGPKKGQPCRKSLPQKSSSNHLAATVVQQKRIRSIHFSGFDLPETRMQVV